MLMPGFQWQSFRSMSVGSWTIASVLIDRGILLALMMLAHLSTWARMNAAYSADSSSADWRLALPLFLDRGCDTALVIRG